MMSGNPILLDPGRLRQALSLLGVSQAELARASGVSTTTISLLLAARRIPSQDIAVKRFLVTGIAAYTTAAQLFNLTGKRPRTHAQSLKKSDAVPMSCRSARCARARSMNIAQLLRRMIRDTSVRRLSSFDGLLGHLATGQ